MGGKHSFRIESKRFDLVLGEKGPNHVKFHPYDISYSKGYVSPLKHHPLSGVIAYMKVHHVMVLSPIITINLPFLI